MVTEGPREPSAVATAWDCPACGRQFGRPEDIDGDIRAWLTEAYLDAASG